MFSYRSPKFDKDKSESKKTKDQTYHQRANTEDATTTSNYRASSSAPSSSTAPVRGSLIASCAQRTPQ